MNMLPCPFCGAEPQILQRAHPAIRPDLGTETLQLAWIVQCLGCTAETASEHKQWAIDYWNRRVAPASSAAMGMLERMIGSATGLLKADTPDGYALYEASLIESVDAARALLRDKGKL